MKQIKLLEFEEKDGQLRLKQIWGTAKARDFKNGSKEV